MYESTADASQADDSPEQEPHSLHGLIADNGGTIENAFRALQFFFATGHCCDIDRVKELRRELRRKSRKNVAETQTDMDAVNQQLADELKKPRMHANDPGIPELMALAETLPWLAGIKPAERSRWRHIDRPVTHDHAVERHRKTIMQKLECLLHVAAAF